jgi:transposase
LFVHEVGEIQIITTADNNIKYLYLCSMEKIDFRTLSDAELKAMHRSAIRMLKKGKKQKEVAESLGCNHRTVCTWWKAYRVKGESAIIPKKKGRKMGEKRRLTSEQEKTVQKMIIDKHPEQLKLPYALWTRQAVVELIDQQFGISLPIRTVGDYLKRWGFTPQKPIKRSYEQQPAKVQQWLNESYPAIKEKAKEEQADIMWCDETGFSSEDTRGRGYSPKGKTPVRKVTGKRFTTSMVSAIDNQGQMRWMVYKGAMNIDLFLKFLKRLVRDAPRKVFLIVDNLKAHHSKRVAGWLQENKQKIELFFLPAYNPELNPDEYVNNDVKTTVRSKPAPRNQEELEGNVRSYMRKLRHNKKKVTSFFEHEKVKYAKAS